jgi:hypothetical protein
MGSPCSPRVASGDKEATREMLWTAVAVLQAQGLLHISLSGEPEDKTQVSGLSYFAILNISSLHNHLPFGWLSTLRGQKI